jgi:DNA-binding winged helix-turn-helix (wHTH) protein/Tfp pilus assembly protein PilF
MSGGEVYEFGTFTLDAAERRLVGAGGPVALAPKALDVLIALVRNAGRLVTKRELLDRVWPGSFVEEGILAVHISALRKAFGDGSYIETVPRFGYRFTGVVGRSSTGAPPARRPEFYELVGRGRSHLLSASYWEAPKAVAAFREAIAMEPGYAAAHAGLALACCAQAEFRLIPHAEAYQEARTEALRALAMDDACAEAQVALSAVLFYSDWNWTGAERSVRRALEMSPGHTEALLLYGRLLEALGALERGLETKQKALERDPSPRVHLEIALASWNQRRYGDSMVWAHKALEIDPRHLLAREFMAGAYWKQGDFDRHMAENIKHAECFGVPAEAMEPVKRAYAAGGRAAVVKFTLERLRRQPGANDCQLALFYGEAGRLDAAFEHLEKALDSRDPAMVHLAVAPQWDTLRGDARFQACLQRMGLRPFVTQPQLSRVLSVRGTGGF